MTTARSRWRPATALLWLWLFLALPRLAYFADWHGLTDEGAWRRLLLAVALGIARDGLVIAPIVLLASRLEAGPKAGAGSWPGVLVAGVGAVLLSALVADAQFFRYFGFHATLTHVAMLGESRALAASLSGALDLPTVIFGLAGVPLAYLYVSARFPGGAMVMALRGARGFLMCGAALALGLAAGAVPVRDLATSNLAENWFIAAAGAFTQVAEPSPMAATASLGSALDTLPLPRSGAETPEWIYADPEYPLIKATRHHLCRLGRLDAARCAADSDGDGWSLADDCNDRAPGIHPRAVDTPRNGVDEDCSGLDADPPNIISIHWEGARAVNVGSLGHALAATPRFDEWAGRGVQFGNAYANGTQTRWSLISVYAGILPRLSTRWIFEHNPDTRLLGFPTLLAERGYENLYLHGGTIGYAGKLSRFTDWFPTRVDREHPRLRAIPPVGWGLADRDLFEVAWDLVRERPAGRPFFLTIATLSLHHPFPLPDPAFELRDHRDHGNQIANVMHYSDAALGAFLDRVFATPGLENTLVMVWSDHGINWYRPHREREQNILWEDLVWVPLALIGDGWNLPPGRIDEVRQLADIGPTILDRLGIEVPNPYVGHSLLRRFGKRQPAALFATSNGGHSVGVRQGDHKFFAHLDSGTLHLYDMARDRRERVNLASLPAHAEGSRARRRSLEAIYAENERLIREDRVWDSTWRLAPGIGD